MIELPEATVLAEQIKKTLTGQRIIHVIANASPHKFAWFTGDPIHYPSMLTGKVIQNTAAFGNYVEIHAEDKVLVISTPILYHAKGEKPPKKHQLWIEFEDCTALSCTVQMWGGMLCLSRGEEGSLIDYRIAKQKPSPFSAAFDPAYFVSLFAGSLDSISAKEFLATKQRIPGLGNGVLQDILWTARVHPRRKLSTLSPSDKANLYTATKDVLSAMTSQGGRDTERDFFGHPGGYQTILSKNTVDTPCPNCGTPIRKEAFMGGAVYTCATCQPL